MSENSPFKYDVANASPGFLLWKLMGLWQARLSQTLSVFEITQTQYAILASLRWLQEHQQLSTQAALVTHTKIEKMTLSKAIRQLESFGLVVRTPDEHDKRAVNVQLTAQGNNIIADAIIAVENADEEFFGVLNEINLCSYKNLTAQIINQNDLLAVASSTLSSQLNNWASQMFDNWNFGVNFRSTGEGNDRSNEYEFNFLYTPNNRITFNGNVGYRDDNLSASKFIGDFDFEYTLIQSGKLSAKAYTHTNDYKEFKSALTTQGIGLVYRESFNSLAELWDSWKSSTADSKKERDAKKKEREEKAALKQEEQEKGK